MPDGRFHVRSGGQDVALPPAQAAQAVGLPLADFESRMAQATQAALAAPRPAAGSPPAAPPIWQGRARHGDYAEVISRNPDGTFQVRVAGKELTRTERDVAYMTGLTKAPLYAMLAKATEGRMESSYLPNQEHNSMAGRLLEGDAPPRNSPIDQAMRSMEAILPGVMGRDAHILNHANDLLNSDYATRRRPPFTADEIASIRDSEGFHDPVTGQSFTFASQVRPKPGESAAQALIRVALHESLGHGGVNRLLANNPRAQQQFDFLVGKIMELDPQGFQALAADPAYAHLNGDARALALEWLAQKSETRPDLLSKPNVLTHLRNVLGQAISALQVKLGLRAETGADLDRRVDIFLYRARQAAVRGELGRFENLSDNLQFSKKSRKKPLANWENTKSIPTFGHTFLEHGQKKSSQALADRAVTSGKQVGQFLDDDAASKIIAEFVQKNSPQRGVYELSLPDGFPAKVYLKDRTTTSADAMKIVIKSNGMPRTSYPFNTKHPS